MPDLIPARPVVKRPSRRGRWFRAVEFAVQLTAAVLYVIYAIRYYQITTRLNEALAQMDRTDPGWRLQDIEAARAVVPDEENSALTIMAAVKSLRKNWTQKDAAMDGLSDVPPERRLAPELYTHLKQKLGDAREALEEARRLEHQPRGRFPIAYARNPERQRLDEEQRAREVFFLLYCDATARVEEGDMRGAMSSCRAAVNAGRSIGDEPFWISQLIREAGVSTACSAARRALAQGEPEEADLKSLQQMLEAEDAHPYWQIACRDERAFDHALLEALESGELKASEEFDGKIDWLDRWFPLLREDYVRFDHPDLFIYVSRIEAAGLAPPGSRSAALHQVDLQMAKVVKAGPNASIALLATMPHLSVVCDNAHALFRSYTAALAAERYRRAHGDWPQSLDQLVPDYLATLPTDPFSGNPLLYVRREGGVVVYSVGEDGKDDGGAVAFGGAVQSDNPFLRKADVGVRLWDVAKRRQSPLPPPAAPPGMPPPMPPR